MDKIDEAWVVADARDALERVEHRREEEPGQQESRDEMLDIAVEGVERGDRQREPRDEADDECGERNREPDGVASLRHVDEAERDDDREHHSEADELRRDDRERQELSREADLPDQVRVLEQAAGGGLERGGEEDPHR